MILNHADRNAAQRAWVDQFFQRQVRPLLVPVGLDPAHPFPQVANKSLNFIARLGGKDAFGRANTIAIVKVPRVLPRVIRLPDELAGGQQAFVLLTSVIRAHLGELFPGREVEAFSQFRVTRDSRSRGRRGRCRQPAPGAALRADDAPLRPGDPARGRQHLPAPSCPSSCCSSSACPRRRCTASTARSTWAG